MRYAKERALKQAPVPPERMRRLARRLHGLGPRPLYEFLVELDAGAPLLERLEKYAALDGDFIRTLNGDHLPVVRLAARRKPQGRA
jgi:hypothetical protein